jgi:hypothetical protein
VIGRAIHLRTAALALFVTVLGALTPSSVSASCFHTGDAASYQRCLSDERQRVLEERQDTQRRILREQQQQRQILERMEKEQHQQRVRCTYKAYDGTCKCWSNEGTCNPWK